MLPTPLLRAVGYWRSDSDLRCPEPQALVNLGQDLGHLCRIADYLRRGKVFVQWRGLSYCRFECGISERKMGSKCLTDGAWVWPEGLAHYVECHYVALPDEFVERALRGEPIGGAPRMGIDPDREFWIAWAKAHGAVTSRGP